MNATQASVVERVRTLRLSPAQILIIGFVSLIGLGTLLLLLPFASARDQAISPLEALFTATSAVCVTGLIVLDTPNDLTLFGQIVILVLVQIGGLGYMTIATVFLVVLGKRIGLRERMILQEAMSAFSLEGLVRFSIGILKFTLLVEFTGAVLLAVRYLQDMTLSKAIYFGIFHALTAFNNAGFALFSNSLINYRSDLMVNGVVMALILLGGIGFIVYQDVLKRLRREVFRLSVHTKVVLATTLALIVIGWVGILLFEHNNPKSLQTLSWADRGLAALFHSVSARTTGFNTLDIGSLNGPTLYLLAILMFIGASPGSTGGGIKTTTLAIMGVALWSTMRGHGDTTLFYRRISPQAIAKAFFLATLAMVLVTGITLLLLYSENQEMIRTLFEVVSAFATAGLSTGDGGVLSLSALFSGPGKVLIIITMLLGRIGPLLIGMSAIQRPRHELFRYPMGKVIIG